MYDLLKFLHILAAIVWVGGAIWVGFFGMRVAASKDPARGKAFAEDMVVGSRILMFSGIAVFVFGAWMVLTEDVWEWEQAFVVIGILAVVIGAVLGGAFFGPRVEKAVEAFEAGRPMDAIGHMQAIAKVSQAELVLLLVVVFSMVAKWGA